MSGVLWRGGYREIEFEEAGVFCFQSDVQLIAQQLVIAAERVAFVRRAQDHEVPEVLSGRGDGIVSDDRGRGGGWNGGRGIRFGGIFFGEVCGCSRGGGGRISYCRRVGCGASGYGSVGLFGGRRIGDNGSPIFG